MRISIPQTFKIRFYPKDFNFHSKGLLTNSSLCLLKAARNKKRYKCKNIERLGKGKVERIREQLLMPVPTRPRHCSTSKNKCRFPTSSFLTPAVSGLQS